MENPVDFFWRRVS